MGLLLFSLKTRSPWYCGQFTKLCFLYPTDLEFLKRLQYKVNLIPVIAKADTLTKDEVQRLKNNINKEIEENDIEVYQFPGTFKV